MNNHHHLNEVGLQIILIVPLLVALFFYLFGVVRSSLLYKKRWPTYRTSFWIVGILLAAISLIGPLANLGHTDFRAHMFSHLFIGMMSPLLMVLAAPITLLLRTLPVVHARRISRLLRSWPFGVIGNPIFTSLLTIVGMCILYITDLYMLMQQNMVLHLLIHLHFFMAGYLFTASILYIDPTPHRKSFVFRSVILMVALASHGILSKYIFAHPPSGVSRLQAEAGGMIMFYGGDVVEGMIIFILFYQWYKHTRPRVSDLPSLKAHVFSNEID